MNGKEQADLKDLNIASDLDHEVKLLAERTGIPVERARSLMIEAGSLKEALQRAGGGFDVTSQPN